LECFVHCLKYQQVFPQGVENFCVNCGKSMSKFGFPPVKQQVFRIVFTEVLKTSGESLLVETPG